MHSGVTHGDIISPKLFTYVLKDIFKKKQEEDKSINDK